MKDKAGICDLTFFLSISEGPLSPLFANANTVKHDDEGGLNAVYPEQIPGKDKSQKASGLRRAESGGVMALISQMNRHHTKYEIAENDGFNRGLYT